MDIKYAEIIVNNRGAPVDRPFTYILDGDLKDIVREGMRVIVPFGRGNNMIKGIVVNILDEFHGKYKLKPVRDVLDDKPLISKELIDLAIWMKDKYLSPYLDAFQPVLPPGDFKEVNTFVDLVEENPQGNFDENEEKIISYLNKTGKTLLQELKNDLRINKINPILNLLEVKGIIESNIDIRTRNKKKKEKWVRLTNKDLELEKIQDIVGGRAKKQLEIVESLYKLEEITLKELMKNLETTISTVRAAEEKGVLEIFEKEVNRNPIKKEIKDYKKHYLSPRQKDVYDRIIRSFHARDKENEFLIHGVTGSGKTEIYLQLVEEMLEMGRDSIILVPEISLTPQTIDRFVGRFRGEVAVIHSKLSHGERFDQWRKIKEGKVKIVVGARSAVFAPFKNLGLIIIDEEHETTYKSSQNPKYDTIEVAAKRMELEKGFLVMGTATPSLESYYKARAGHIVLLELENRVLDYNLPEVNIVDMREELTSGNKSMFSLELYKGIKENLENNKQTILFLNRRGFSTFVSCRSCGYVVKCKDCDVSMTYHRNINKLRCHYCGLAENPPPICPVCQSKYIRYFGVGTEKVEELIRELFPEARVIRMDTDTTSKKGSYERDLGAMKNKEVDILIGTQMIAKGLDFEGVTLVGIIAADTSLNLPDFRSAERTFQLVTQVAGRAGRGENPGRVILQTYEPDHYSILYSKEHDYKSFYKEEIKLRDAFFYPPFINMISILIYGQNLNKVEKISNQIYNILVRESYWFDRENIGKNIIGPYPAPLERIRNNFRWLILLKVDKENINKLKELINRVCIFNDYKINMDNIKISIDIDPNSIL